MVHYGEVGARVFFLLGTSYFSSEQGKWVVGTVKIQQVETHRMVWLSPIPNGRPAATASLAPDDQLAPATRPRRRLGASPTDTAAADALHPAPPSTTGRRPASGLSTRHPPRGRSGCSASPPLATVRDHRRGWGCGHAAGGVGGRAPLCFSAACPSLCAVTCSATRMPAVQPRAGGGAGRHQPPCGAQQHVWKCCFPSPVATG